MDRGQIAVVAFFWHEDEPEPEEPATVSFAADLRALARKRGVNPTEVLQVYCRCCQLAGEGAAALFGLGYVHSQAGSRCTDEDIRFLRRRPQQTTQQQGG